MRVLVSGASGLVGSALSADLQRSGHEVRRLVRGHAHSADQRSWDPTGGVLDPSALDGVDAVVHLSGETVAGRWTDAKKRRIRDSRIESTKLLAETMAALESKPRVFSCASAIGYYGDRGDEILTEDSEGGSGFLSDVVRDWEAAAEPAAAAGVRVLNTRFGIVLSPQGGMLGQILTPFKLGVGGPLGSGNQYMSWVAIDDLVSAVEYGLRTQTLSGPVNVTSPNPVTNREFTKALGSVLHRPTVMKVPAFALKLAVGEFSSEALGSLRVVPERLSGAGFGFGYPQIEAALAHLLGKEA